MNLERVNALRKTALVLVWIGEVWNLVEAAIALWSGIGAGSVALIAFGLDSVIELFAGGVLIWHLSKEWKGEPNEDAERRALRLVGVTFFLLCGYILAQSIGTMVGLFEPPEESMVGIALVSASAVLMTFLFVAKMNVANKLGSRALRAEAKESLVCDIQDVTLLVGLGLNALLGWWWADPVVALALVPFLLKEGWEAWTGDDD
jgi:divalent metal cation (Fe/Co/Zn/Cd) transporter